MLEQTPRSSKQKTIGDLGMMSTTTRYAIKPKTLTLMELCQSISDFRHPPPPPSIISYPNQVSLNTAQILTRRLYLHPLTVNPNGKHQLSKLSANTATSSDNEQRHQPPWEKYRDVHHSKVNSSHQGLAVLSSAVPLTTRISAKPDARHSRDKASVHTDDDTNSDCDVSMTASFNQTSLTSFGRGSLSTTRGIFTRPLHVVQPRKTYVKPARVEKINAWHDLDRSLQRPTPLDPPTTPLGSDSNFNIEYAESENQFVNYNSIQEIQIYKRKPREKSFINEDHDYDDYNYD